MNNGSPCAVMRSIFIGSPPLKTVFSFLFSYNLIIRRKPENINGFSVQAMYKYLAKNGPYCHSWQLTGVWRNRFAGGLCTFSGFVDLWYNNTVNGNLILMSEPQFWFNLAALRRVSDDFKLSIGTEVEISNNFVYTETGQNNRFYAIPTIACKWEF